MYYILPAFANGIEAEMNKNQLTKHYNMLVRYESKLEQEILTTRYRYGVVFMSLHRCAESEEDLHHILSMKLRDANGY